MRVYVCNVATQPGETDGFGLVEHVRALHNHIGPGLFDYVIYNTAPVPELRKGLDESIFNETRSMVREFSELLETVTEAYDTGNQIDPGEADMIREKWEDLKACVERFVIGCERGHYHIKVK